MRKFVLFAALSAASVIATGMSSAYAQENTNQQNTETPERPVVTVVKGDSLTKIASAHETTYQRIYDGNMHIADPNVIHPGEQVSIPLPEEQLEVRTAPVAVPVAPKPAMAKNTKTTKKTSTPKPAQTVAAPVADGSVWDKIARCESGGNWSINTGNGYYGGLQFSASSWRGVGGSGLPHQASREEQISRAEMLLARQGWGAWPSCSSKLGLR